MLITKLMSVLYIGFNTCGIYFVDVVCQVIINAANIVGTIMINAGI